MVFCLQFTTLGSWYDVWRLSETDPGQVLQSLIDAKQVRTSPLLLAAPVVTPFPWLCFSFVCACLGRSFTEFPTELSTWWIAASYLYCWRQKPLTLHQLLRYVTEDTGNLREH